MLYTGASHPFGGRVARAFLRAGVAVAVFAGAPAGSAAEPRAEAERLQREIEILRQRVDLAKAKDFYLVIDPTTMRLKLMLRGAILQDYKIVSLEVGQPRVAFVSRDLPADWEGRIWTLGKLDPPREQERMEIVAPPPEAGDEEENLPPPVIPPTPEEAYPVPPRYLVRYEGGLALEVSRQDRSSESAGFWSRVASGWSAFWTDLTSVLRPVPKDTIRLRLVLDTKDADSLYRALPPDTKLLIVPPM
jgi:hypothetical protein